MLYLNLAMIMLFCQPIRFTDSFKSFLGKLLRFHVHLSWDRVFVRHQYSMLSRSLQESLSEVLSRFVMLSLGTIRATARRGKDTATARTTRARSAHSNPLSLRRRKGYPTARTTR